MKEKLNRFVVVACIIMNLTHFIDKIKTILKQIFFLQSGDPSLFYGISKISNTTCHSVFC